MAIKYVEDYRKNSRGNCSDTEAIQMAVDNLKDGDTLIFNKKVEIYDENSNLVYDTTYVLDAPIHLTSYKRHMDSEGNVTETGKTRRRITFDGNGCTIKSSSEFSNYIDSHVRTVTKKVNGEDILENVTVNINLDALFVTSDIMDNYVCDSHFKNFIFKSTAITNDSYKHPDNKAGVYYAKRYLTAISEGPSNPGNYWTYNYLCNSKISNCEFYHFYNGIKICGLTNTIEICKFDSCTNGIFCDCPNQVNINHNYFYTTEWCGINLTKSYRAFVCNNYFYHCMGYFIKAVGTFDKESDSKTMSISICSNTLEGGKVSNKTRNQTGILLSGIKKAIIKDNFIYNMKYLGESEENNPGFVDENKVFGVGIYLDGNNNTSLGYRSSDQCIVSGNEIYRCMRYGIKLNHSHECIISNNMIHRDITTNVYPNTEADPIDYAVYLSDNTERNKIGQNMTYCYDNNNSITVLNIKNRKSDNLNYEENMQTVDGTTLENDPAIISIPVNCEINEGEYFYIRIPDNYNCQTVSFIKYGDLCGEIYSRSFGNVVNLTSCAGETIKLKYTISTSKLTNEQSISFTYIDC